MRSAILRSTITAFLFSLLCSATWAQELNYDLLAESHPRAHKHEYVEARSNQSEMELAFSGLFLLYKNFFSSQDAVKCNFIPSCSEFGILAVKEHGVVNGIFLSFDRLTRCHRLSPEKYEMDEDTQLLIDHP